MIYSCSQHFFGMIYLLVTLSASILCGYICSLLKSGINRQGLFAIGFSFAPCLIGSWMILFSFLPNIKYKQYICVLCFMACIIWAFVKLRTRIIDDLRNTLKSSEDKVIFFLWMILVAALLLWCIVGISGYQVYYDASFYMAEALKFAKSLSFYDIASHRDYVDGTLQGSVHNFLWPAYISFGLLFSKLGEYGLGNDFAGYISFILAGIYLIVAILGVLVVLTRNIKISSAMSLALFFTPFFTIINAYSRDLFRCIPLVIFTALLYVDLSYSIKGKERKMFNAFLLLCCFFVMGGHPINAFTAGVIGCVWLVLRFIQKKHNKELIVSCVYIFVGVLVASYNFIYAIIDTGSLSGNCSLYPENIYQGSSILQVVMDQMASTMVRNNNAIQLLRAIFVGDKFRVCFIAFICSVVLLGRGLKRKKISYTFIPLVYSCSILLIFIGTFIGWEGFTYAEWLSRNQRYMYQFYVLAIMCIGQLINEMTHLTHSIKKNYGMLSYIESIVAVVFMLFATYMMLVSYNALEKRQYDIDVYNEQGQVIYELYNSLNDDEYIMISENQYSYVTDVNARVLASHFGEPLFRAKDKTDVYDFFLTNKIKYICLNSVYLPYYWKDAIFYTSILELCEEGLMTEIEPDIFMMNSIVQ